MKPTEKKYEFTGKTIEVSGKVLHRIKAVRDFGIVKAGTLGGYIEKEENLSHEDNCWAFGDAKIYGNAVVFEDAKVFDNAKVFGNAKVFSNAEVFDNAKVFENASVFGNSRVYVNASVFGNSRVYVNAEVFDNAKVFDIAEVYGDVEVFGNAEVCGDNTVYGNTKICGNAKINAASDYIVFKNWWSSGRCFTWTRSNNMWKVGCFYGTGEELIKKAYQDSELSGREYERVVKYVESILADEKKENEPTRTK